MTLWLLLLALLDPLQVLDLRITVQQNKLRHANLTLSERRTMKRHLREDMASRYKLLELIDD